MAAIDETVRDQLHQVNVSTLTTCLFKRGFRNRFIQGVSPVNAGCAKMVGEAFTLRFIPAREDIDTMAAYADDTHVQRRAMEECPPGNILVIDSMGDIGAASAGDIMLGRLKARGVEGAVTDGGFRDAPDIEMLEFPAFHKKSAPPSSPIRLHPADLNNPIGCGGVAVYPGDIVVGDREGVVVIPPGLAREIAEEATEMTAYEAFAAERVAEGSSIFGLYPSTEASRAEYDTWRRNRNQ
jgi:regulator of RNase E activity RraA